MYSSSQPESSSRAQHPYHRPRPWSPDPYHPLPSMNNGEPTQDLLSVSVPLARQRRETSESSIEALDLADYARTLRVRPADDPYPVFQGPAGPSHLQDHHFPSYPPGSYIPNTFHSQNSLSPPSLVSRIPTLSSNATHSTSRSGGRRPFSLPTPNSSNYALHSTGRILYQPQPRIADPQSEVDIAHFPAWSRSWYDSTNANPNSNTRSLPIDDDDDLYTPIPYSSFPSKKSKNMFDPGYVHNHHGQDLYHYPNTDPSSSL